MSADLKIESIGNGVYDLVLAETDHGIDAQLIGNDAATHPAATLQRITYNVLTWLGESPYDRQVGFPWEQAVFGVQPIEAIPVLLQQAIQDTEGVKGLAEPPTMLYDPVDRVLQIRPVQVEGDDFTIEFEGEVLG